MSEFACGSPPMSYLSFPTGQASVCDLLSLQRQPNRISLNKLDHGRNGSWRFPRDCWGKSHKPSGSDLKWAYRYPCQPLPVAISQEPKIRIRYDIVTIAHTLQVQWRKLLRKLYSNSQKWRRFSRAKPAMAAPIPRLSRSRCSGFNL